MRWHDRESVRCGLQKLRSRGLTAEHLVRWGSLDAGSFIISVSGFHLGSLVAWTFSCIRADDCDSEHTLCILWQMVFVSVLLY